MATSTSRTLYQRFGSKDGLVGAYLRRRAHAWQTHVLAELDRDLSADPARALALVFDAATTWSGDPTRGCAFVNAWAEIGPQGGIAADVVRAEKDWMRRLFREITGEAEAAAVIHTLYEGAGVCASLLGDVDAYPRARAAALAVHRRTPATGGVSA